MQVTVFAFAASTALSLSGGMPAAMIALFQNIASKPESRKH
jgi:hypothetical protein